MSDPIPTSGEAETATGGAAAGGDAQLSDDHPLVKALAAQKAQIKELKSKAMRLDEIEAAQSEANKSWEQKYRDMEAKLAEKELAVTRAEVAAAKGVPANRIVGSTREEMEADADELAALLKQDKPKTPPSGLKSGATGSDQRMDPKERAAAALRNFRSNN